MYNDLKDKINHYIKQKVEENNNRYSEKEIFLKTVYETLVDVEDEHSELYLANYESPSFNLRVDGFDFVTDNLIDIYISMYSNNADLLSNNQLTKVVSSVENFILQSIDNLHEQLSQADIVRELSEQIHYNIREIKKFRIIVLTNMQSENNEIIDKDLEGHKVQIVVYDINKINELNVFNNDEDVSLAGKVLTNHGYTVYYNN